MRPRDAHRTIRTGHRVDDRQLVTDVDTSGRRPSTGREEELVYELKQQGGKWVIDDIRYLRNQPTTLSRMLETGAKETP